MRRRLALVVVAVMLVGTACSSGSHRAADPTTTSSTSTTVPPGPDPYVVPSVITPAYVNAVFRVLNHIEGDVSRELVAHDAVTPRALADLRALFNDPLYSKEVTIAQQSLAYLSNVRRPPGDVVTTVVKIISASPTCIFVSTHSQFGAVVIKPVKAAASEYWVLKPKKVGNDPENINPTPWALSFNADYLTPTSIPDQCDS